MRPEDVGYDQARPLSLVTFMMCFSDLNGDDDGANGLVRGVTEHVFYRAGLIGL